MNVKLIDIRLTTTHKRLHCFFNFLVYNLRKRLCRVNKSLCKALKQHYVLTGDFLLKIISTLVRVYQTKKAE